MSSSLEIVKKIVEEHLKRELDILEMVLKLNEDESKRFYSWYVNHPLVKGIEEVVEVVRGRADRKTEGSWVKQFDNRRKNKGN